MRHKSANSSKGANKEGNSGNNETGAAADKNNKSESNASPLLNEAQTEATATNNPSALFANLDSKVSLEPAIDVDLINKRLPKELLIRIFSYLDIITLCRCAQVSNYWNLLALDGSNWQHIDLFDFQTDVNSNVVENISKRCNEFLKTVRLENCKFVKDESIKQLCLNCKNIESLNLKQCTRLTDESYAQIGTHLSKLVNLSLESCQISDEGLMAISKGCPKLEFIDISWCTNLTSNSIKTLAESCSELKYFLSRGLVGMNDSVLKKLTKNCTNLKHLCLNSCSNLTDEGIISIAENCRTLKFLSVSNCNHLTDACLIAIGKQCTELMTLEVSGCSNFSDAAFTLLARNCHHLERVDLEECTRITDQTLQSLAANCSNLKHLTLSRCECITDEGIRQLGISNCAVINETLQVLELDNCPLITDASLEQLYSCHSLAQIELYDCQLITRSGIKKLQNQLPNVKIHAYFAPSIAAHNQRPARYCSCKCCTIL